MVWLIPSSLITIGITDYAKTKFKQNLVVFYVQDQVRQTNLSNIATKISYIALNCASLPGYITISYKKIHNLFLCSRQSFMGTICKERPPHSHFVDGVSMQ